jgi:hypothetical protein
MRLFYDGDIAKSIKINKGIPPVPRCAMASAQWNRAQQSSYRGSYQQQTESYITGNRSQLIRCSFGPPDHRLFLWVHMFCSDDFFGDAKPKRFGLYVVVPEGYQWANVFCVTNSTTHHDLFRYSLEKFGKFFLMLEAGMHILVPFVDQITFTRCLKTGLLDCPPQVSHF